MNNKESRLSSLSTDDKDEYKLQLFVAGASANSVRAIVNIKQICESYLKGNYSLQIIDIHQEKLIAEKEQVIALPLLIKRLPLPERRLIGDMSEREKVIRGLGLI